ncbi:hypothetical protein [Spirosoma aerolatum]|uniref:hypothetical protein n=1 Tax=Spirosoma aerolatum TaxID=1211326 RepID=UPI0009AEF6A2|nr:hypothetical protein [Spirosoma aerolatum]
MKKIAEIWYVPLEELVTQCYISEDTIRTGYKRGSQHWQSIVDPADRRRRLIRYDTMATKYQSVVRRALCGGLEPWEVATKKSYEVLSERYSLPELLEQVLQDGYRRYLGLYPASDTSRDAEHSQKSLARAAAVVELLGAYIREREIKESSYAPYDEAINWLESDGNYEFYFPKKYLPCHRVRLKEKVVQRFGKPGVDPQPITDVIKLPREGNKSRDKFKSDEELNAWLVIARLESGTPDQYVVRKIQEVCRVVGREVPSNSWFVQAINDPKIRRLTADSRHGVGTKLAGRYKHSISMARAMYAGDCWMMDATRVNFIAHQASKTSKEQASLFVIAIRDAYSGDIVGVHFDTKEDRWGYANALKMAAKSTGYLPHTLVYDRFPGHITDEMQSILGAMERKGVQLICTHKATGKALLERWFDTLQTVFLSRSKYYYGQGITSTRTYAHRSPEHLLKVTKEAKLEGWDFDKAWQEAWKRIEEYRQTPVSYYSKKHTGLDISPATLHAQSEKPNVIPIEIWEEASLFWMTKIFKLERPVIRQTVHGQEYEYHIYDNELMNRESIAIRYEEADPTRIMLFGVGVDGRVSDHCLGELEHSTKITMYGPGAEKSRLAGRMEKIDQFQDRDKAELERITSAATYSPEYLLSMNRFLPKEEQESNESRLIYAQMGLVVESESHRPANAKDKTAKPKPLPTSSEVPDTAGWINKSFYNQ